MRTQMIAAGLWEASDPRDPSESIEAAWSVVEKMRERGYFYDMNDRTGAYVVVFDDENGVGGKARTLTPAMSICLAALAAVDGERGER